MGYNFASSNLLLSVYTSAKLPAPLGKPVYYKGGKYVLMKAGGTIVKGDCVAFQTLVNPVLCTITKTVNTDAVTAGLAIGFACVGLSSGEYGFVWVGGQWDAGIAISITNDGGDFAAGDFIIPDLSGTDGQVVKGTAGTHDHLRLGNVTQVVSGTTMGIECILVDRFSF